jgi:hypothetical protein
MPLPDFLSTSNTFRQWLATTNNLTSHIDNTSVYILASQNATPRVTTGNVSVNGTITLGATTLNTTAYTGTATNATNLNSQPGSFYTNASNLATGTVPDARISGAYTGATSLALGANVVANLTTVFVGNATNNTVITGGSITINGSSVLTGLDPVVAAIALG